MASVDLGIVVIVRFAFALPRPLLLFSLTQSNIGFFNHAGFSGFVLGHAYGQEIRKFTSTIGGRSWRGAVRGPVDESGVHRSRSCLDTELQPNTSVLCSLQRTAGMRTDIQTMPVCHGLGDAAADSLSFRISIDSRHKPSRLFADQHRLLVAIGCLRCMLHFRCIVSCRRGCSPRHLTFFAPTSSYLGTGVINVLPMTLALSERCTTERLVPFSLDLLSQSPPRPHLGLATPPRPPYLTLQR